MNKDVYLLIADNADDKTVVNMLSVDRKFHDPEFFECYFLEDTLG